jgi:amidase
MKDIQEMTISGMQARMDKGDFTSRELVFEYFSRISRYDTGPDGLNSVLELNPEALSAASEADEARSKGNVRGPLHGIPVLLKDNICTADMMHISAGALALADKFGLRDAFIVTNLRKAGAVILGKANMTEMANYMTEGMPNGCSSRGGQVKCPYKKDEDPSGSSSGSAVAVSANLCAAAVGTETSGSIISPAQTNGITGFKPTMGLVSRSGIVPISVTLDTAGPMTRCVEDAASLLEVLAGRDPDDPTTCTGAAGTSESFSVLKQQLRIRGKRIGINRTNPDWLDPDTTEANERLITLLEREGAVIIDHTDIDISKKALTIMKYEFKTCLNSYLARWTSGRGCMTLQDIIEYNCGHADTALRYGQKLLADAQKQASGTLREPEYISALKERENTVKNLLELMDQQKLDLLFSASPTNIAPFTGFPALTVPIGIKENKMPIGSYWIARRWQDRELLAFGAVLEEMLGARQNPLEG